MTQRRGFVCVFRQSLWEPLSTFCAQQNLLFWSFLYSAKTDLFVQLATLAFAKRLDCVLMRYFEPQQKNIHLTVSEYENRKPKFLSCYVTCNIWFLVIRTSSKYFYGYQLNSKPPVVRSGCWSGQLIKGCLPTVGSTRMSLVLFTTFLCTTIYVVLYEFILVSLNYRVF